MEISRNLIGKVCNIFVYDTNGKDRITAKVVSMNEDYILIENSHGYRSLHRKDHIITIQISKDYLRRMQALLTEEQINNETL